MALAKAAKTVSCSTSMKRSNSLFTACCQPRTLYVYYLLVLLLPNIGLTLTEPMGWAARLCNLLLPLGVYAWMLTLSRRPGKALWWLFPLVFLAAFQLVLLYLFGRSVIAVDMFLNLLTSNPGEAIELLDNLIPGVAGVFIVYLPALALGICSIRGTHLLSDRFRHTARRWATLASVAGLFCLGLARLTDAGYRPQLHLYPVNAGYNLWLAIERTVRQAHYAETSRHFRFHATSTHDTLQAEAYVLVIGETARACHFSLYGYPRETNPLLSRLSGLTVFKKALTQSNTTHKSVPMLLTAVSAERFDQIYQQKGILTAFREAGYHTFFFSNQRPNHSFIDFLGQEADEWHFLKEERPPSENLSDSELLAAVGHALQAGHRKLFIVLHTYGSHFNYRERYPREMAHFQPDSLTDAKYRNRASLVNAYDNSLRQTDALLARLTHLLQAHDIPSAWLYTSDHGEDLFDDHRRLFLHASPLPTYYQLHVPLLVWLSPAYRHSYPQEATHLHANAGRPVSVSVSVFHTMLQLAGLRTPFLTDSLSLASDRFTPAPPCYLDDHNRPIPLGRLGLDSLDRQKLDSLIGSPGLF